MHTNTERNRCVVSIAGATTGSGGLVVDLDNLSQSVYVLGPGITPLEFPKETFYQYVVNVCNSLYLKCVTQSRIRPESPTICYALSGLRTPEGQTVLREATGDSLFGDADPEEIDWIRRGEACLLAGRIRADAVVVKVGTVAFAHAFGSRGGREPIDKRVGGWGMLSGDDGGAYDIGRQILYRLFEEADGREPGSEFTKHMLKLMGTTASKHTNYVPDLARWIANHGIRQLLRTEVSSLARIAVYLDEEHNDKLCNRFLRDAARRVARSCSLGAKRLMNDLSTFGRDGLRVVLHGGLVQHSMTFAATLCCEIQKLFYEERLPAVTFIPLVFRPVVGCLTHSLINSHAFSQEQAYKLVDELSETTGIVLREDFRSDIVDLIRRRNAGDER